MFRSATVLALVLMAACLLGAAPAPPPPPPDNGPAAEALREAAAALDQSADNSIVARSRLWCAIADLHRKLGDTKGAVAALKKARQITESVPEVSFDDYRQIGQVYGRLGDAKAVTDLAASVLPRDEVRSGHPRTTILQESAVAAGEAGYEQEAEQIASLLADAEFKAAVKAWVRRAALVHQAQTGEVAGALRAVDRLPTPEDKVHTLVGQDYFNLGFDDWSVKGKGGIAAVQIAADDKAGAKESALKALALLPDVEPKRRSLAILAVVRMLARLDDRTSARKALAQIPAADPKAADQANERSAATAELMGKGYIVAAEVRAGRDEAAVAMAADFPVPGKQAYILQFVALAQARAGRIDASKTNFSQAVELVAKAQAGSGTSLHNIASAQALAGDFAGATKTAENASGSITWGNVAGSQADAGDFAGAKQIVATRFEKNDGFWRGMLCSAIAQRQAKAGQVAAVKEWAAKEDDPLRKAYLLVGLAEGLYQEGGKVRDPR